ncbi:MAG: T9SS type A sorting domain-containing protein [Rhodothermaceae bacterium]|nr:T9SS type A sorting domain-containing protein [Rhodothermaceae bacterium]
MPFRYVAAVLVACLFAPLALAQNAVDEAKAYLQRDALRYGLTAADVADVVVTDAYTSRRSGTAHVYLRQSIGGIDVLGTEMTVNLDRTGRVFHATGSMRPNLAQAIAPQQPSLDAAAAVQRAATHLAVQGFPALQVAAFKGGPTQAVTFARNAAVRNPIPAQLMYRIDAQGTYRLTWQVEIAPRSHELWLVYVDALTGAEVARQDLMVADAFGPANAEPTTHTEARPVSVAPVQAPTAPALVPYALGGPTYRVYPLPIESPNHAATVPPTDGRSLVSGVEDATASPFGWHDTDGAAGAEFTTTQGNNVHAYLDQNGDGAPDAGTPSPDGGAGLVFDFPLDFTMEPSAYEPASVTNLFYLNNVIHDLVYQYGFDEASGNFQENNYGNGGLGSDHVFGRAQESADIGGRNNAFFGTPSDGLNPDMLMLLWNTSSPERDGDFDAGIVAHEFAHGISNRLTGGPSNVGCLDNAEQMGEGWSDWYGIMLTMEAGDVSTDGRGVGTYALNQSTTGGGIRPAPYSTSFGTNGFTYQDTRTQIAPHGVGFVWATILWEATWELIEAEGLGFDPDLYNAAGTAGNQIMLNLVTEGMKLQPCSPGFVDGRDAILAADQALYGGAHIDALWRAFARRGLGIGADQGSSGTNDDNTEDFAEPETIAPSPVTDLAASVASLGVTLDWTATGDDATTGTASVYDLRYSTSAITNDTDFDAAMQADGEPTPQASGNAETFTVTGLDFDTEYFFALKVQDNSFNVSDLSNIVSATTLAAPAADVSTDPIIAQAESEESTTVDLSLGNTGGSDLTYTIDFVETTALRPTMPQAEGSRVLATRADRPKGAADPAGTSPLRGSGGPDAFGYTWIDSDEPGGPAFDWVDISGTGTAISLSDDDFEEVALPFPFDFYGVTKTTVKIGSNGYLTFGGDATDFSNDPIPSTTDPNDFIAPFWDDINPTLGGTIHYQDMGDGRFVVQYTDVHRFNDTATTLTFQVILSQSGSMLFQYDSVVGTLNSATIGIENAEASDGLAVVNSAAYVHDDLAVRISSIWVSASPAGGTVASGNSETITLTFDAAGLADGTYTADMTLTTNEPETGVAAITIPLTFTIGTVTADEPGDTPGLDIPGTHLLSPVYPNPFAASASFTLAVAEHQTVRVEVFDALGRRVALLHEGPMASGARRPFTLDGRALANGAYVIRLTGEAFADTRRVTLLR